MDTSKARKKYLERFGLENAQLCTLIDTDICIVFSKWKMWLELYQNQDYIDLMNRVSPVFWAYHQSSTVEAVIHNISRLTDPISSVGKDNITIKRLPDIVDSSIRSKIEAQISKIDNLATSLREWRNKVYSHKDYHIAMGSAITQLPPAQVKQITDVIDELVILLRMLNTYCGVTLNLSVLERSKVTFMMKTIAKGINGPD